MGVLYNDLPPLALPALTDKTSVLDVSDTTDGAEGTLKLSTLQSVLDLTDLSGYQPLSAELTAIAAITAVNDDVIQRKAGAWVNRTLAQLKSDLALGNVDNTSDANKPISTATQTALDTKVDENAPITGATKTKITYDTKGLITSGADLADGDIPTILTGKSLVTPTIHLGNNSAITADESGGTDRDIIKMDSNNRVVGASTNNDFIFYSKIKARAYLTATQSNLVSGTPTKIALGSESYDPGGYFDATTNYRFVAPIDGYYRVSGQVAYTSASVVANRAYNADIYLNGAPYQSSSVHAAAALGVRPQVNDLVYMTASQYIELYATSVAGVDTVDVVAGAAFTFLTVFLVSI